jgi:hypothetical protein
MPADDRFAERVRRIETGRQWRPDGIVTDMPDARRRRRSGAAGFYLWAAILAGAGILYYRPEFVSAALAAPVVTETLARAGELPVVARALAAISGG